MKVDEEEEREGDRQGERGGERDSGKMILHEQR
jgi:hypothetical protein